MSNIEQIRQEILDGNQHINALPFATVRETAEEKLSLEVVIDAIGTAIGVLQQMQRSALGPLMHLDHARADVGVARAVYESATADSDSPTAQRMLAGVNALDDHAREASLGVHRMSDEAPQLGAALTAIALRLSTYGDHYGATMEHLRGAEALQSQVVEDANTYLGEIGAA